MILASLDDKLALIIDKLEINNKVWGIAVPSGTSQRPFSLFGVNSFTPH